jgi:hypothetical protein
MTLPALSKTWRFATNINVPNAGSTTDNGRAILLKVIQLLLGTTGSWTDSNGDAAAALADVTVVGSSNGLTSNMSGTNLVTLVGDLISNSPGSSHSWVVLHLPGLGALFHLKLSFGTSSSNYATMSVSCSHSGFGAANGGTDGSHLVDPTALNEVTILNSQQWGGGNSSADTRVHAMRSTDGQCTRILLCRNNRVCGYFQFDKAGDVETGWTTPFVCWVTGDSAAAPSSNVLTVSSAISNANQKGFGASAMSISATTEMLGSTCILDALTAVNAFSGNYPLFGLGYASVTGGNVGRSGFAQDLWGGLSSLATLNGYPDTGDTNQFVQFGCYVFPWNKTTALGA